MRTNTISYNSLNNSDFKKFNDLNVAQEEADESESNSNTSNRDTNGKNESTVMGSHFSFDYLKCSQKCSDIHTQPRLTTYRGALYFQCNYYTQKYKKSRGIKNIKDYFLKLYGRDGMNSVQLNRKKKN